jgi:hypothetical protein
VGSHITVTGVGDLSHNGWRHEELNREPQEGSAAFLVERRLAPTDQFALADYDDQVRLLARLGPVGGADLMPVIGSSRSGARRTSRAGG